jgi:hypothetical protein
MHFDCSLKTLCNQFDDTLRALDVGLPMAIADKKVFYSSVDREKQIFGNLC